MRSQSEEWSGDLTVHVSDPTADVSSGPRSTPVALPHYRAPAAAHQPTTAASHDAAAAKPAAKRRPTRRRVVAAGAQGVQFEPLILVEVVSDEDGLRGAHFAAVVVGPSAKPLGGYTVEYESLVESEDSDRLLREDLPARVLRPRPPKPPSTPPAEHAAVDARIDDVWWIGVALGRVGARGKVRVCFPDIREVMEFDAADVRPHLDWVDGEWRSPDIMIHDFPCLLGGE